MKNVDPRDRSKSVPDGTRCLMIDEMGHTGLWVFPDGTAYLADGVEIALEHDKYWVLTFRGDVITTIRAGEKAELDASLRTLVSA